ncbi:ankyrin-3 [Corynascus novoguineensis]|uniref:Ankyrin-3 n=1 Tax=Corynascus novoguineensis TaxID=1126955 RepID=A0AAN7CR41_9PEZI|nr:ankyrin-3 [Corynascus novoguineensis]
MDKQKQKEKRSLYEEALDRFRKDALESHSSSKDVELLNEFLRERATPEETKQAAEVLQGDAGKKYGGRKVGDVDIPASWIANIMENIENFVAAGDFVTQKAPESVGMAWYAVKLTLTAIHTNYDLYTFFGSGLSDISEIMIIVRHYDLLYDERSKPNWKPNPSIEQLFQYVIGAYSAVLDFSFAIKRHLTAGALTRIKHGFKDFFGLSKAKFEDKLNAVASFKKKILEESQGIFQDKTLRQLESVSDVLAGIEGTVRHIQSFQDTQKQLHEEAMARLDVLLKGLEDIRASTKRKTQWDYAVQDFQTFQEALDPLQGPFEILGDTIDAIYPGTCQWVFEHGLYQQWAEAEESSLLCLTGPEGSGKSYAVAAIADRITRAADPDNALLYVTCSGSTGGTGLGSSQSYTADSICRTFLSQLYELAVQGEDNVGLLETCNAIFKKAKAKSSVLPTPMRSGSDGLPEFADGFSRIAKLLKKKAVLILDGVDANTLDNKSQEELLRKIRSLMAAMSEKAGIGLRVLIGCSSSSKLFNDLDLSPDAYIDVQYNNQSDIELVLTDALKNVPGLSASEQETAKEVIMERARSRFLYVRDTAIPFMQEPFQRPLSKRLDALPDGTSDVYAKVLNKMSSNYLDLLSTALTWTVLCSEYPGYPHAREVMDFFQGTYDVPPETDAAVDEDVEEGFPATTRLELEQLRAATDPFLRVWADPNGTHWLFETDETAVAEYFVKSGDDIPVGEAHEHLCARCGSTESSAKQLYIDPKQSHLQMALTCLRHLNNPLFQRRAGLIDVTEVEDEDEDEDEGTNAEDTDSGDSPSDEDKSGDSMAQEGGEAGASAMDSQPERGQEDNTQGEDNIVEQTLQATQDQYAAEDSVDDEDVTEPNYLDFSPHEDEKSAEENDSSPNRIRYELQFWRWHLSQAEALWPAEERENNSDWEALMSELDKFAFDNPEVFAAWQSKYPEKSDEYNLFRLSEGPHKPLHVAAYFNLVSWTQHLLDRGEDLNELSKGYSALQAAACSGEPPDTLELLLDAGADPNAENGASRNALQLWFLSGDITVEGVRMFLDHGADPRVPCSNAHFDALQYFANRGEDPEILELLLGAGANINAVHPGDGWRLPALQILLARKDIPAPLLEAFVKHNADTNFEDAFSARPLQIACVNGQLENLKILLQSKVLEINDTDFHGTTAVHEATFYGYYKCVEALLEHDADPDITDKLNRVALHTAARKGFADTVRVLLKYTKQANLLDKHGWNPLFCACLSKDEESADLPLSEINISTRSGRTVLRQAADHGFTRIVTKLIQLASDRSDTASLLLDARDTKKGMTALHRAAANGHAACVQALLAAGADPALVDGQSRLALALAYEQWSVATKKTSYEDILAQLISAAPAAAVADADLVAVCAANGSVRLLDQLWRLNADLNRPDRYGWTPLALARRFGRVDAEGFLKRQAAWANLLPCGWEARFPGTTPAGAVSVLPDGSGKTVLHTSRKRLCISADRPLPEGLETYYFEVTLKELPPAAAAAAQDKEWPEMAIGFCTLGGAALEFPGWWAPTDSPTTAKSWGYHSDTGGMYSSVMEQSDDYVDLVYEEQRYRVGDTVGAGVDLGKGEIWFTRNGVKLDRVVKGVEGRLFPVVGLHDEVCFETNFGREGDGDFMWKAEVAQQKEVVPPVDEPAAEKQAAVQVATSVVIVR